MSLDAPPLPSNQANQPNQPPTPEEDLAARIRQVKLQQFEEAVKSKTTVSVVAPRSPGLAPVASGKLPEQQALLAQQIAANQTTETDPVTAYEKRLVQLKDTCIIRKH